MGRVKIILYSITWFFVLVLFAWWVGFVAGLLYCVVSPCAACCDCCKTAMDYLANGARIPYLVATFMVEGKSFKSAMVMCYYNYYQNVFNVEESYQQC